MDKKFLDEWSQQRLAKLHELERLRAILGEAGVLRSDLSLRVLVPPLK